MGVFKNFYIHISQSDATDVFSNCTYSRQERKQRQSICWQERLYSIFSRWLRQPDHTDGQSSTIEDCMFTVWDRRAAGLIEIDLP